MPAPKVFLSHASEDKERFVLSFATALRSRGVDAWLDKWEILPGDSLVDKLFEEGLKEAQAIVVVISKYSVSKPWVRQELNAAMVHQISRKARVIPVVLDDSAVPESLKTLLWVPINDLNDFGSELDRIVAAVWGHHDKPDLGSAPSYVNERPIPGLHQTDAQVLRRLYEDAIAKNNSLLDPDQFVQGFTDMGLEAFLDSLEILDEKGFVKLGKALGWRLRGIHYIQPTLNGFMVYARANFPQIENDIRTVALAILNEKLFHATQIAQTTGVPPFIVDKLLDLFVSRNWIEVSKSMSDIFIYNVSPSMKRAMA